MALRIKDLYEVLMSLTRPGQGFFSFVLNLSIYKLARRRDTVREKGQTGVKLAEVEKWKRKQTQTSINKTHMPSVPLKITTISCKDVL